MGKIQKWSGKTKTAIIAKNSVSEGLDSDGGTGRAKLRGEVSGINNITKPNGRPVGVYTVNRVKGHASVSCIDPDT